MAAGSRSFKVDEVVSIKYKDTLEVDPKAALIAKNGVLTWDIDVPDDHHEVEIDFVVYEGSKGPFERKVGDIHKQNPRRGRYWRRGSGKIDTARADRTGYWKYDIIVRRSDLGEKGAWEDVLAYDPGVIIKDP